MALTGERILITGATGMVAEPLVRALSVDNDVVALARYRNLESADRIRSFGGVPLAFDLATGDFGELPDDFTVVLNFAVDRNYESDFDRQMVTSAEATGLLMARCHRARAFLQCSSNAVYHPGGDKTVTESAPLGDHHRLQYPTYSIGRIIAEAVARANAREFELPTVIARLTVPYGSVWGFPARHLRSILAGEPVLVHPEDPQWFTPIHEDDIISTVGTLVDRASVPAFTVNWAGDEQVRMVEWCRYIGELLGIEPRFEESDRAFRGVRVDGSLRKSLTGPTAVDWRTGVAAMVRQELDSLAG